MKSYLNQSSLAEDLHLLQFEMLENEKKNDRQILIRNNLIGNEKRRILIRSNPVADSSLTFCIDVSGNGGTFAR